MNWINSRLSNCEMPVIGLTWQAEICPKRVHNGMVDGIDCHLFHPMP